MPKDKLKVIINNDTNISVKEVRQITLSLYNLSDKDFEKTRLYLGLNLPKNNQQAFQIISSEVETDYSGANKQLQDCNNALLKKSACEINILNRSDLLSSKRVYDTLDKLSYFDIRPVFRATYIVAGENLSDISFKPTIEAIGVKTREISFNTALEYRSTYQKDWRGWIGIILSKNQWFLPFLPIILMLLSMYVAYLFTKIAVLFSFDKRAFINIAKDILLKSGDLQKWHGMSDPKMVAQELVNFNAKIRYLRGDKNSDEKFMIFLSEKLSQPNELDNFRKLDELETLQYLSDSFVNIFIQKISFVEFLTSFIMKPFQ